MNFNIYQFHTMQVWYMGDKIHSIRQTELIDKIDWDALRHEIPFYESEIIDLPKEKRKEWILI